MREMILKEKLDEGAGVCVFSRCDSYLMLRTAESIYIQMHRVSANERSRSRRGKERNEETFLLVVWMRARISLPPLLPLISALLPHSSSSVCLDDSINYPQKPTKNIDESFACFYIAHLFIVFYIIIEDLYRLTIIS